MLEFLENAGTVTNAGLAIPISDLPMVEAGEFVAAESTASKEGKAMLGIGLAIQGFFDGASNLLGFLATKGTAISGDLVTLTFSVLHQKYSRLSDGSFGEIPVPTAGDNNGIGGINIEDVFPNAEVVSASDVIGTATTFATECVVIPNADIADFSNGSVAALGSDKRDWINGLYMALGDILTIRSAENQSAITAVSNPNNYSQLTLPANYTASTNPLSGIPSSDLGKISSVQKTASFSVQTLLTTNGTYDVNVATS